MAPKTKSIRFRIESAQEVLNSTDINRIYTYQQERIDQGIDERFLNRVIDLVEHDLCNGISNYGFPVCRFLYRVQFFWINGWDPRGIEYINRRIYDLVYKYSPPDTIHIFCYNCMNFKDSNMINKIISHYSKGDFENIYCLIEFQERYIQGFNSEIINIVLEKGDRGDVKRMLEFFIFKRGV